MLPFERQQRIKALVQKHNSIKISELSKLLGVSEMTIHRDVKPFVEEGLVIKTFGGIAIPSQEKSLSLDTSACEMCHRPLDSRLSYKLIFHDQHTETFCCPHCGILRCHQTQEGDLLEALCRDFLTGTITSAAHATYVIDSTLDMQCCKPQVLCFEFQSHAEKFVRGFDGKICTYMQTKDYLLNHSGNTPSL
ncbi:HTH-type transcriptional repressor YcnK [Lentibacillus sp. JNUCC-1]|uniref:DeoR family transcriptional regulator n=1 Tax=Lentibacillus sp. JNUCC-1 TaxID=2654513 RepID=UPI0012E92F1D|nr:DeoR family transcriptional regulator [Lentibacillus sp. JNUCC-1]MUV39110.1 HTH-type transcriptional repressor YcnK [Lentibacillus sp. JNUCC-1]